MQNQNEKIGKPCKNYICEFFFFFFYGFLFLLFLQVFRDQQVLYISLNCFFAKVVVLKVTIFFCFNDSPRHIRLSPGHRSKLKANKCSFASNDAQII